VILGIVGVSERERSARSPDVCRVLRREDFEFFVRARRIVAQRAGQVSKLLLRGFVFRRGGREIGSRRGRLALRAGRSLRFARLPSVPRSLRCRFKWGGGEHGENPQPGEHSGQFASRRGAARFPSEAYGERQIRNAGLGSRTDTRRELSDRRRQGSAPSSDKNNPPDGP